MSRTQHKRHIVRINGNLHEITKSYDNGKLIHTKVNPLHVEFKLRDVMQVIIGASVLAVPVGFTEETWRMGSFLPWPNILAMMALSLAFVSLFVYYDSYRNHLKKYTFEYLTRITMTYLFAMAVVATVLTIIDVAPWATDWVVALKRVIIVTFPATVSAAITDTIK